MTALEIRHILESPYDKKVWNSFFGNTVNKLGVLFLFKHNGYICYS